VGETARQDLGGAGDASYGVDPVLVLGKDGWPNTQTSPGLITAAPPIGSLKLRRTVQARPSQCRARDWLPPVVKAQTSAAEVASAAMTTSLGSPGNGAAVHDDPLRRQAKAGEFAPECISGHPRPSFR
jgi:hypothetical protein